MKKKIRVALIVVLPLVFMGGLGGVFYLVLRSPEMLTPAVEWGISRFTRAPVTLGHAEVLQDPFRIVLRRLYLELDPNSAESYLEIEKIKILFSFSGSFGKRTLWIDALSIDAFEGNLSYDVKLPDLAASESPESSSGLIGTLLSAIAFRQVRLKSAQATHGRLIGQGRQQRVALSQIDLRLDRESFVTGSMVASVDDRRQEIELPGADIEIKAELMTEETRRKLRGEVVLSADRMTAKGAVVSGIEGRARAGYTVAKQQLNLEDFELSGMLESVVHGSGRKILTRPVKAVLNAGADIVQGRLTSATWCLKADDAAVLQGSVTGSNKSVNQFAVNIKDSWFALERLGSWLPEDVLGKSLQLEFERKVDLEGDFLIRPTEDRYQVSGKLVAGLSGNPFSLRHKEVVVQGILGGSLGINGAWPGNFDFEGGLESRSTRVVSPSLKVDDLNAGFKFAGRYPQLRLKNLNVAVPAVKIHIASKKLALKDVRIFAAVADWDLKSFSGRLPALRIDSDSLKSILIALDYKVSAVAANVKIDDGGIVNTMGKLGFLPGKWQFETGEALRADFLFNRKENGVDWRIGFDLNGLTFENPDQSVIAENLGVAFKANGNLGVDDMKIHGRYDLACGSGEMLLDRFYLNFEDHLLNFAADFNYGVINDGLKIDQGRIELGGLVRAAFEAEQYASDRGPGAKLQVTIPATDIVPLYNWGLKEPFELDSPMLAAAGVTGTLAGDADFTFEEGDWELKGRWQWHAGSVILAEKNIRLDGIQLDLPLWVASGFEESKEQPLNGNISIAKMQVPFLAEQPLTLALVVTPNHVSIPTKTSLAAEGGGMLHLWPIETGFGAGRGLQVDTRLDVDDWRLDAGLSRWWPSQGPMTINAKLNPVQVRKQALRCQGTLLARLFGGDVQVENPRVDGLFSSTPVLGLDVDLREIDMAALTDQTSFGKIEGILQGHIDQLEIVNKQPQRFALRLETIPQKGVAQKISVKAVESIARIGGGQSPFIGMAGQFAMLFKKFGYRKIGAVASLENDVFRINGLIHEKGREYLVKKSGLSGVDVVNSNPDNRIGFKDMVKRIQRVLSPHARPVVQ